MKRLYSVVIAVLFGILASFAEQIKVQDIALVAGNSTTLEIGLENANTNLVAFQMDLTLPEGIGIDKAGCKLSSRITDENQVLTIGRLSANTYRLTSTSLSLKPISGTSGTLLTLKLTSAANFVNGQVTFSNVLFSTATSQEVAVADASFTINSLYNLTYQVDGEVYKTSSVAYGTSLIPENAPTKEGYTFSGWSEIPATMPANDVVITGTFSVNSYTLTYKVDGEVYKTSNVAYGTVLTPETAPTKEGYTFSGWSEIPATMPANDVVITGTFSVNNYTLTYKVDGEVYKTSNVAYGTVLTPETAPTKEGYTFSGWSEIPATMPANNVVVTGTFKVNTYAVTFMYNDKVLKVDSVEYGAKITLPTSLDDERYALVEWLDVPETMPAHDITIYASITDGIRNVSDEIEYKIYDERGQQILRMKRGLNIIKYSNGRIRKVIVK